MVRWKRMSLFLTFGMISLLIYGLMAFLKYHQTIEDLDKTQLHSLKKNHEKPMRIVHLDLKGGPPKISYLENLLSTLYYKGCNGLLIEYEDMFPFDGILKNISAKNAYTKTEIRRLIALAHDYNMEVIPLVQTFGHLEFVLKLEQFRNLRELDAFPDMLCPSKKESLSLITEMVTQIMVIHPSTKFFHIGCDEVYHLAACDKCSLRNPVDVYSDHVISVAQMIKAKYSGVTVLVWDDMMRKVPLQHFSESPLLKEVEPMIWAYGPDVTTLIPNFTWYWFNKLFKRVWVAGAFKGASTSISVFPDMEKHYLNQKSWLKLISKGNATVGGIVLTGWSRFDHFAVLCELLPVSLPSLFLSLAVITKDEDSNSDEELYNTWLKDLNCPSTRPFNFDLYHMARCDFDGVNLFKHFLFYKEFKINIENLIASETKNNGWFTSYNLKNGFSSPFQMEQLLSNLKFNHFMKDLSSLINVTRTQLLRYYDSFTTEEWIEQNLTPLYSRLKELSTQINTLSSKKVWARRPINFVH